MGDTLVSLGGIPVRHLDDLFSSLDGGVIGNPITARILRSGRLEGAGRFNCPHGIFIDRRKAEPELYVADRANHRVQVYDMEGRFKRSFGDNFLSSPRAFVTDGDLMVVAELRARLAVLDLDDNLVCYLGDNEDVCVNDG